MTEKQIYDLLIAYTEGKEWSRENAIYLLSGEFGIGLDEATECVEAFEEQYCKP